MDKELYIKILEKKLPKMREYSNEDWQLQFDNDLKYTSKMDLEYLKEKNKCIRMAFIFFRFVSNRKHLGSISRTAKQKYINKTVFITFWVW